MLARHLRQSVLQIRKVDNLLTLAHGASSFGPFHVKVQFVGVSILINCLNENLIKLTGLSNVLETLEVFEKLLTGQNMLLENGLLKSFAATSTLQFFGLPVSIFVSSQNLV